MTTIRENIIQDIISSLAGTTNVSTRIYRSRVVPLGGYAIDVQPGPVTFEMGDADQPYGVIYCEYLVRYRTDFNDLTSNP